MINWNYTKGGDPDDGEPGNYGLMRRVGKICVCLSGEEIVAELCGSMSLVKRNLNCCFLLWTLELERGRNDRVTNSD